MQLVVGRGWFKAVKDDGAVQTAQLVLGPLETQDKLARLAEFGFASNPPDDSDAIVVFISGDRSNGVIIATGHQTYRIKNLGRGEVALYDAFGHTIKLLEGGITVDGGGHNITITNTPKVHIDGQLEVTGDIKSTGGDVSDQVRTIAADRTKFNSHTHDGGTIGSGTSTGPTPTE